MLLAEQREFTVADAHQYDRRSPIRWIVAHVMHNALLPILGVVGFLAGSGLYSIAIVLTGQAFDIVLNPTADAGASLLRISLAVLAARVGQSVVGFGSACAFEVLGQRIERDSRAELYISLLGKSQTFHNRQQVGDVMARATSDVQMLNGMINPGLRLILEALPNAVIPLIAIWWLRAELLLVPVVFLVLFVVTLRQYNAQLNPLAGAMRGQFGVMNARLTETISGIEVVKAYAQELAEQQRFISAAQQYRDLFIREGRVRARYLPLLLYGIAFGLGFGHALLLLVQGSLTVGQVVAYMGLITQLRFLTYISLFSFSLVQFGIASAKRILDLLAAESEVDENINGVARPIRGAICFEQVSFGYNQNQVLTQVSFQVQPGEMVAIVGQTGAGKTTLTRLVNRIYDATNGRVLIDGVDVRAWTLDSLRSQIATIEQDVFLFSRTIAENIAFGAAGKVTHAQIEQAARAAQAHEFIMSFPDGYDTLIGERGVMLSGGQRQRLAIARAFLVDPQILILDDSTSAIDSATEDQIQCAIRALAERRTTVLITHRLSQIRWADRILVLRHGALIAQGTHDELLAQSEDYRQIFADNELVSR